MSPATLVVWRKRSLWAVLPFLWVIAALSVWTFYCDVRELETDEDLGRGAHPLWTHDAVVLRTLARIALAVGATLALAWSRDLVRSRSTLRACWLIALALYVLPAFVPFLWHFSEAVRSDETALAAALAFAPITAVGAYIDLMPVPPSVCSGIVRAGLRLRGAAATPALGALAVFGGAMLLACVLAAILGFATPIVPSPWVRLGLAAVLLHYLVVSGWGLRRLGAAPHAGERRVLRLSAWTLLLGGLVALGYGLQHVELLGKHLVAFGETPGLLDLWRVASMSVEFATRAQLTAIVLSDLLLQTHEATPKA